VRFDVVTIFPQMFEAISKYGITARALEKNIFKLGLWNPRDYTQDKHRNVDDRPYGGGPGMVMMIEPLLKAVHAAKSVSTVDSRVIYLSPQGIPFTQEKARELTQVDQLILIAGRYEGVDERLIELEVDEELSLGDYVLSGGEIGAMAVIDAVVRLIPGALGHEDSAEQDSFSENLLDCPHYTRPDEYQGLKVPEVLLSGNHQAIDEWRQQQATQRTRQRRPDLLGKHKTNEKSR
jgi:tRNA (guanine37-N1)-methyltransferase